MSAHAFAEHALFCVGVSHADTPLGLLERLTIPADSLPGVLMPFSVRDRNRKRICEGVVLSTCNRTEIYAAPQAGAAFVDGGVFRDLPEALVDGLVQRSGLPRVELAGRFFRRDGWAAAEHLLRVVCGLDSLVVGESQIVGQVARAYAAAQSAGATGVVLSTLFQSALRGGRRARARIHMGTESNAGTAAVARAARAAGTLAGARVVVVGTGEIGRVVLHALRAGGAGKITVVSRSEERAAAVAARWGWDAHTISQLPTLLDDCDILINTTRASARLVSAGLVAASMKNHPGRRLVLVDLSVPRSIDPETAVVKGVQLLDIDSLKEDVAADRGSPEALRREGMIADDLVLLKTRMTELFLRPVLGDLWRKAAAIRGEVLERTRARLPQLDEQAWRHVEELATSIVARILHDPATRLRATAGNGHSEAYAEALRELFRIPE